MKYSRSNMVTFEQAKAFLDKEYGEHWYNDIDLGVLDMSNPDKCILGQLFQGYAEAAITFFVGDLCLHWAFGLRPQINWEKEILKLREEKSMKKHKHHDLVIAWLDGVTIEWRENPRCGWETLKSVEDASDLPGFYEHREYRIKPVVDPKKKEIAKIEEEMRKLADRLNNLKDPKS